MKIEALRTPEHRFADLPCFPWSPRYATDLPGYDGLRMAWLDEGPRDGHVFLCLHGEPTWSYLYRKMIPVFLEAGGRVVAPDLFGFGRSDKPVNDGVYSWDFHRDSLLALVDRLDLGGVTLVCQDWGGLLGLTLPVDRPELVARLLVMNTALATGVSPGPGFEAWKTFVAENPHFDLGGLMSRAAPGLSPEEVAAYEAPFPSRAHLAGVRTFPALVPVDPDMDGAETSRAALAWWRTQWSGPTFMAVGEQDPVLGPPAMRALRKAIAGCPEPLMLPEAGHFVQEHGEQVARAALAAWGG